MRSVLEPFLLAAVVFVGLYMVADVFGKLSDFLREADTFLEALRRMGKIYFLRIPTLLAPVIPIAMLIGASYGISQLSGNNELTAMRASGISLWRIIAPVYAVGAVVALLGFANQELLIPRAEALVAPELLAWRGKADKPKPVIIFPKNEETCFIFQYNLARQRIRNLLIANRGAGEDIRAKSAEILPGGQWKLTDVTIGSKDLPEHEVKTAISHHDIELNLVGPDLYSLRILRRLIEREPENSRYRVIYHTRLAYPFTAIVLMALGLPFVIGHQKIRSSRMLGVGVCIAICLVFFTVQFFAAKLGNDDQLPAAVAAWLPTVMFGALGFYLLETVHS